MRSPEERAARRRLDSARAELRREYPAGPCAWCGRAIDPDLPRNHPHAWTADHVIAQSRGGAHDVTNLRPMHRGCNSARGDGGSERRINTREDRSAAW